jgi:NRPS condensation-like uncharacterized protein
MKKSHISQVDTLFANGGYPIEFLLYFSNGLKTDSIRKALKFLAPAFWPIFGSYETGIITYNGYSESMCFDEMISNDSFNSGDKAINIYHTYSPGMPQRMEKLFFLKVIQHKNGTVLIPKLNHLAGDGYSYFYFLAVLAAICRGSSRLLKKHFIRRLSRPQHHRSILRPFRFDKSVPLQSTDSDNLSIEYEYVARKVVRERMREISSQSDQTVSANDLLAAMALKKTVQVEKIAVPEFELTIPIDVRRYIKKYGRKYFGNGLMINQMRFKTEDINIKDSAELAPRIRTGMPNVCEENYITYLNKIEDLIAQDQLAELRPYNPETGCLVTNLSKMPVNKLDFGTGEPDHVFLLTLGKNSAAILADEENYILRLVF